MEVDAAQEWFHTQLRLALGSLYNPPTLRKSPLVKVFGIEQKRNPALALQAILLEAIEALRPAAAPAQSDAWRLYQVLRRRYTEQVQQAQVADDMGLSTRQLQRTESQARAELGAYLWHTHHIGDRLPELLVLLQEADTEPQPPVERAVEESRSQELDYLSRSLMLQQVHVGQAVDAVFETVAPLAAAAGVVLNAGIPHDLPPLLVQEPLLHQALVNLTCCAIEQVRGKPLRVVAAVQGPDLILGIQAGDQSAAMQECGAHELIKTAGQLLALCGGSLAARCSKQPEAAFCAELALPALEQTLIVVVDDNVDTQQLYSRHLAGSRYRVAGALNASAGMELALEDMPHAIVLDVMMPDRDGWALLGQLREHPATSHIPVIVCSILPQEQLALVLGAAEFLRKPVSRDDLLAALERQVARQRP